MTGARVTIVGTLHLVLDELVRGKRALVKVGDGKDSVIISVPERFINFTDAAPVPEPPPPGPALVVTGRDGTQRQTYYGPTSAEQPWDTIGRKGWGVVFAGGNVLKYLRRQKSEDDLQKACWYWDAIHRLVRDGTPQERVFANLVLTQLNEELTKEEVQRLVPS